MGDALKSQKKGLKIDVTRMGYLRKTVAKTERVSVWLVDKTVERSCMEETVVQKLEGLCVEGTICETGPLGK